MARETGTVKWFNYQRGYGLISPDDGGEDRFVHHTAIVVGSASSGFKYLLEGEKVVYEAVRAWRGIEARDVCKVYRSPSY
jgi:CspA family cold shock protein